MNDHIYKTSIGSIKKLLHQWLEKAIDAKGLTWLEEKSTELQSENFEKKFFLAFSATPRFTGREKLNLTQAELNEAAKLRKGWRPKDITAEQAARIFLTLSLPLAEEKEYVKLLDKVFSTADVGELIALYSSLPLLPYAEAHVLRAREGLRSNMMAVFEAVAINNPYPADHFEEEPWNHLVLKALFVDSAINDIYGIDERANPTLARMLSDYAHERWAAGREVNPLLWRPIGKFIDADILKDIKKLFESPNIQDQKAAALACSQSGNPEAKLLLIKKPELLEGIKKENITWNTITKE